MRYGRTRDLLAVNSETTALDGKGIDPMCPVNSPQNCMSVLRDIMNAVVQRLDRYSHLSHELTFHSQALRITEQFSVPHATLIWADYRLCGSVN